MEDNSHKDKHNDHLKKRSCLWNQSVAGRNDKVTVQYPDGRVLKDVKYKKVEDDIHEGKCIVIEG